MNDIGIIWLSKGAFTIVDIEDYPWLNQWKWCLNWKGYAVRQKKTSQWKLLTIRMHRLINKTKDDLWTDHINNYKLDNRRGNLRDCTNKAKGNFTSKYKGVWWSKQYKKWESGIRKNNKQYKIGNFTDETEAAKAYNQYARVMFGEFARLNEF